MQSRHLLYHTSFDFPNHKIVAVRCTPIKHILYTINLYIQIMHQIEIINPDPSLNIYILRKTIVKLIATIVKIEIIFAAIFFVVRLAILFFDNQIETVIDTNTIYIVITTILAVLNIIFFLQSILSWIGYYYIIKPGEIIKRQGVIGNSEEINPLVNIEGVQVKQSLFASMLNFGDLIIRSPLLEKDLIMQDIPNPRKYQQHIFAHFKTSSSQVLRSASTRR